MLRWPMDNAPITLFGYEFSVYTRVVRMTLLEKDLAFSYVELDPFRDPPPDRLHSLHPFGRVPALTHGSFRIYETAAITRYLDAGFPGADLTPPSPAAAARMQQVIGIVDAYGYRCLVRQAFSNLVFARLAGQDGDPAEIRVGLEASRTVLGALETIALEGLVLNGSAVTLADLHLVPMIDYFRLAPDGNALLQAHPALLSWWTSIAQRPVTDRTRPDLSALGGPAPGGPAQDGPAV